MLMERRLLGDSLYNPLNFLYWANMDLKITWTNPVLIIAIEDLEDL